MKSSSLIPAFLWLLTGAGHTREPNPRMLKDLSYLEQDSRVFGLYSLGDTLYFYISAGSKQLWKSDGTAAGTGLIKAGFTAVGEMVAVGNTLYFAASDARDGQLWKSNGTTAGTGIVTGGLGDISSLPQYLTAYNGAVYFRVNNGYPEALWKSNGTVAGTVPVKQDFNCHPYSLRVSGNTLYFAGIQAATGFELYKTNGTAAGTVLFKDILPGTSGSDPSIVGISGNSFFLSARDNSTIFRLWKLDAASGSLVNLGVGPYQVSYEGYGLSNATMLGNTLYYSGFDSVHKTELWKSNGTLAGTVMVKDINPGLNPNFTAESSPASLLTAGNKVYFWAYRPETGIELWKSDGTEAGTVMVKDLVPGAPGSFPGPFLAVGDTIYFGARDPGNSVMAFWKSDGTAEGTQVLSGWETYTSLPFAPVLAGTHVYYTARTPENGLEVWVLDLQRPVIGPVAATPAGEGTVKLHASVNPRGLSTEAWFEYGLTSAYGQYKTFFLTPDNGTEPQDITVELTSLMPDAEYHCRLVARSSGGEECSDDTVFTALTLSPLQSWRLSHFGTAENAGDSADDADPDNDGLTNFTEYAFGLLPADRGSSALPEFVHAGAAFTATFTAPAGTEGVLYSAEWSPDMQPGTWTTIPDTGAGGVHVFAAPGTGERVFVRYRVSMR